MDADNGFPNESLLVGPITVLRPLSCLVNDVRSPVRDLFTAESENVLSGPWFDTLSSITNPHLPQNRSADSVSVIRLPFPHLGQFCLF